MEVKIINDISMFEKVWRSNPLPSPFSDGLFIQYLMNMDDFEEEQIQLESDSTETDVIFE